MNVEDREAFVEILLGLAEVRGKELSAQAIELWWNAMHPWPIDAFRQAANHVIRTSAFMPTPADFWNLRSAGEPTAGEAWTVVLENVRASQYRNGTTPGGRIDRAVRAIGGYRAIGEATAHDLQFMATRFAGAYEELRDVDFARISLPAIVNRTQLEKLTHAVKLIGSKAP